MAIPRQQQLNYRGAMYASVMVLVLSLCLGRAAADEYDLAPLCACSPSKYMFTLDFSLTCPPVNVTRNAGISATFCQISPFGDPDMNITDLVPVEVQYVDVLELGQGFEVLTQENITGTFMDGDTIEYTSIVMSDAVDIPKVIQLNIFAFNAKREPIVNFFAIAYSNDCDEYPTLIEGESAGWTQFTKLDAPTVELCPAASVPTATPTGSPVDVPTDSPIDAATDAPTVTNITEVPTDSPTDAPTIMNITEVPTDSPIDAPTDAPTVTNITEVPTDSPTDAPSDAPTTAPFPDVRTGSPTMAPVAATFVPVVVPPTPLPTTPVTAPVTEMSMSMDMSMTSGDIRDSLLQWRDIQYKMTDLELGTMEEDMMDASMLMGMSMSMSMPSSRLPNLRNGQVKGAKISKLESEGFKAPKKAKKGDDKSDTIPKVGKASPDVWNKEDKSSKGLKSSKEDKANKSSKEEKANKSSKEEKRRRRLRVHRVA